MVPAFFIMIRLRLDDISIGSALLLAGRFFSAFSISFLTVRVPWHRTPRLTSANVRMSEIAGDDAALIALRAGLRGA
jgi:hypothetical protein